MIYKSEYNLNVVTSSPRRHSGSSGFPVSLKHDKTTTTTAFDTLIYRRVLDSYTMQSKNEEKIFKDIIKPRKLGKVQHGDFKRLLAGPGLATLGPLKRSRETWTRATEHFLRQLGRPASRVSQLSFTCMGCQRVTE